MAKACSQRQPPASRRHQQQRRGDSSRPRESPSAPTPNRQMNEASVAKPFENGLEVHRCRGVTAGCSCGPPLSPGKAIRRSGVAITTPDSRCPRWRECSQSEPPPERRQPFSLCGLAARSLPLPPYNVDAAPIHGHRRPVYLPVIGEADPGTHWTPAATSERRRDEPPHPGPGPPPDD